MIEFKFQGGKELQLKLDKIGLDMELKTGKKAVRAAATMYARDVKKRIPVSNDGNGTVLKHSIGVAAGKRKNKTGTIIAMAGIKGSGPGQDARRYAHIFEFGANKIDYKGADVFRSTFQDNAQRYVDKMMLMIAKALK